MRRVISLYLPNWPTDRLRKRSAAFRPDRPLVTALHDGRRRVIASVDKLARNVGLKTGETIAYARAKIPDLQVADADPLLDAEGLRQAGEWCLLRYSPVVALDAPDGLWMDAAGCDHFFGGERALLEHIVTQFHKAHVTVKLGVAGTTGAAHALARFGKETINVASANLRERIGPLPLASLRLPKAMSVNLYRLGFETIDQLYHMSRAPLARRFGPELMRRFDQAVGEEYEPLEPLIAPETPVVRRIFAEPICTSDYLAQVLKTLMPELCSVLEQKNVGARQIDLIVRRVDNRIFSLRVGTAHPSREADHLNRLFSEKLTILDLGFGVEQVTLAAVLTDAFAGEQMTTGMETKVRKDLATLIDVLSNRLGSNALYRMQPVESDVPERSVQKIKSSSLPNASWPSDLPRPVILLRRPEHVEALALLPDHAPRFFTWRDKRYRIMRADGPERIFGEWWKNNDEIHSVRDYFRVEDEAGRRFWLFRRGDGENLQTGSHEWFIHGMFG